jgi:hypothetical protein
MNDPRKNEGSDGDRRLRGAPTLARHRPKAALGPGRTYLSIPFPDRPSGQAQSGQDRDDQLVWPLAPSRSGQLRRCTSRTFQAGRPRETGFHRRRTRRWGHRGGTTWDLARAATWARSRSIAAGQCDMTKCCERGQVTSWSLTTPGFDTACRLRSARAEVTPERVPKGSVETNCRVESICRLAGVCCPTTAADGSG